MCGIAGFYSPQGTDRRELHAIGTAMHRAIAHRGPDSADTWQDPDYPLVLSHRRLAIIDLSADGAQPMASHSGRYVIVYNGEIYNYQDIEADLRAAGHTFKGRSDTEVMLTAIEQYGLNHTLQKINGMFVFALWDRQSKQIHFARDRFGKKPLYIGWAGQSLVFGSELKALHAHPDFTPELDRNVLSLYMRFGYVCAPHAIFKNVWQLLPGGRLSLDAQTMQAGEDLSRRMELYWSLKQAVEDGRANPAGEDEGMIIDTFGDMLSRSVKQRMMADVPLGAFLSGGIDSSLITAIMQANSNRPVKTYSIGFDDAAYDESKAAAKIAAYIGTDHHEFHVTGRDALDVIPLLPDMYDEPFADASQIPTYLISKMARSHVTVALTGDGGDEILGGYDRHTKLPALWNKMAWMPPAVRRTMGALAMRVPQDMYDRVRPAYPQFGRRVHRMAQAMSAGDTRTLYTTLLQVWPEKDGVVPGAVMPDIPLDDESSWPRGLSLAEKMIYADLLSYRSNDLMVKADRASMAVALEARAPLMDYELCAYSWRLPHEIKVRGGQGKWLLRQLLERYVPREMFDRPKSGFSVPLHQWLRGPLKGWGDDLLSLDRLKRQGILNAELVAASWQNFQAGRAGHANASDLWTALMFQSWHDRWMK
jgi:asparagine synthase (glutamine-hydrolysing)